jgi:hypothetical protein
MHSEWNVHLTNDELESWIQGRESPSVEEHVLVCPTCQNAIQATVLARKWAIEQVAAEEREPAPRRVWFHMPARVYAGCAAAVLAVLSWTYVAGTTGPIRESQVALVATRSGNPQTSAYALAGTKIRLELDTTSLPVRGPYQVEVVDLNGARVWSGTAAPRTPSVALRINKPMQAGRYWVRLNDPDGAALREFELRVQ